MLFLQSFLRKGVSVGHVWEYLKPKGPKGFTIAPREIEGGKFFGGFGVWAIFAWSNIFLWGRKLLSSNL